MALTSWGITWMNQKILPSKETIRRFHERAAALYEPSPKGNKSRRYKRTATDRDISDYQANEPAPTDEYFRTTLTQLLSLATQKPEKLGVMRRYLGRWMRPVLRSLGVGGWLKLGLSIIEVFELSVQRLLPSLFSCWGPGAKVFALDDQR
jgi:hypothetical protein